MEASPKFEQVCHSSDRAAWLAARRGGIGASEVACLIGASTWTSPLALYAEKIGAVEPEDLDAEHIEWGNRLEPVIVRAFMERTGRDCVPSGWLLRSREWPFALATLDAWCRDGGALFPLEIKTTSAYKADEWSEGAPLAYAAQVQWQMLVAGAERAAIACLIGGQRMVWQDVPRDPDLQAVMLEAARRFWHGVEALAPPDADGSDATRRALARLYPDDAGEPVALEPGMVEVADALELARADSKAADARVAECEARIKAAMGSAPLATLPDGRSFSWKLQNRKGYVVNPSMSRVFRTHAPKESNR